MYWVMLLVKLQLVTNYANNQAGRLSYFVYYRILVNVNSYKQIVK